MNSLPRVFVVCVMTSACLSLCASAAQAQITVGQTASAANPPVHCAFTEPADEIQITVASGPGYRVPITGAITSWSTLAHEGLSQSLTLKVFRKVAPYSYLVVAQDTRALAPNVLNTFPVAIPVQAGDLIGEGEVGGGSETPCAFETGLANDLVMYAAGNTVSPGGTAVFPGAVEAHFRLNVSATVLPPPTVASISPSEGSVKGARVTIAGANFASVTGVSFGSVPAASFTVANESQIKAVAPARRKLGSVAVTVTTAAGATSSTQLFAYQGCKVPKLEGKKLQAAKKTLKKADCKIGTVKKIDGATVATGKVVKQRPKPGKVLAPGSKVSVKLG